MNQFEMDNEKWRKAVWTSELLMKSIWFIRGSIMIEQIFSIPKFNCLIKSMSSFSKKSTTLLPWKAKRFKYYLLKHKNVSILRLKSWSRNNLCIKCGVIINQIMLVRGMCFYNQCYIYDIRWGIVKVFVKDKNYYKNFRWKDRSLIV